MEAVFMEYLPVIHKVLRSLNERGSRATFSLIRKNIIHHSRQYFDHRFDRKFHTDTSGRIELSDLDIDSHNKTFGIYYEPTPVKTLRSVFSNLPNDLSDFVFVDFGSGKGRVLLAASDYNFKKIIGVEFARKLHLIAQNNIRIYRSKTQKCFDIESICMDAMNFCIPLAKSVFYFFNPFVNPVMLQVLDNIKKSYLDKPRKIFVIYYNPLLSHLVEHLTFLKKVKTEPLPFVLSSPYQRELAIYESYS
jgi:hypothetical protein